VKYGLPEIRYEYPGDCVRADELDLLKASCLTKSPACSGQPSPYDRDMLRHSPRCGLLSPARSPPAPDGPLSACFQTSRRHTPSLLACPIYQTPRSTPFVGDLEHTHEDCLCLWKRPGRPSNLLLRALPILRGRSSQHLCRDSQRRNCAV